MTRLEPRDKRRDFSIFSLGKAAIWPAPPSQVTQSLGRKEEAIVITNEKDKTRSILERLSDLLSHGWLTYFCAKSLISAYSEKRITRAQFFFVGCYRACLNETILALSKLLIDDSDSITIYYLLNHAKCNSRTFPYAKPEEIKRTVREHEKVLKKYENLKANIKFQRDRKLAHFDRKHINNPTEISSNPSVNMEEVEECYRDIHRIINAFSRFNTDSEWHLQNIDKIVPDDLDNLLQLIEKDNQQ
jgi:hypothetical protein